MLPESVRGVKLRGYRPEDLDAMYALDPACFGTPFRFSRSLMKRSAEAERACVVVAEQDAMLVAFGILHVESLRGEPAAYLVTLDVAESQRRQGIARQLMKRFESHARENDCHALLLHVFTGNEGAIRFYESCGFARVGRVRNFYAPGLDAWVYRKHLPDAEDSSEAVADQNLKR